MHDEQVMYRVQWPALCQHLHRLCLGQHKTESAGKAPRRRYRRFFKKEAEAKGMKVMTEGFGSGESLTRYEFAKGVAANTSAR